MANARAALLSFLQSDTTLMGTLTGGVKDAETLPREGEGNDELPKDADGRVLPHCVVRWKDATRKEVLASARQTVEFYFYDDIDLATIEAARDRVIQILDRTQINADNRGILMFHWIFDTGEIPAEEYGYIPSVMSRFYTDYTRR